MVVKVLESCMKSNAGCILVNNVKRSFGNIYPNITCFQKKAVMVAHRFHVRCL